MLGGAKSAWGKEYLNNIASFNRKPGAGAFAGSAGGGAGGGGGGTKKTGTSGASTGGVTGGGGKGGSSGGGSGSTTINQQPQAPTKPKKVGFFDQTKVPLKAGTNHTPDIKQSPLAGYLPEEIISDPFAPVGSEDNPHVFRSTDKADWATFGAMHTAQAKSAWDDKAAYNHVHEYTKTTAPYNRLSAPEKGSPPGTPSKDTTATLGLDKAFKDSAVKPFEEYVVLGSSQDGYFFTGANGLDIPDGSGGTKKFQAKVGEADDLIDDLTGLVGQEFLQTNYISTAIPPDKEFGWSNNIRVLFKMKPGQKAVYVSGNPTNVPANNTLQHEAISYFKQSEMEMILPRNQTLKVVAVRPTTAKNSNMYELDVIVEVVDQPNV